MFSLQQQSTILFHPKVHSKTKTMTRNFAFITLLLVSIQLQAQQDSTILEEVVITANRIEQKQSNTGKLITVISRKDIERSPFNTIGELLGRQAGVNVVGANNAPGTNNDIYVRGAATGNTLLLIDGMPAYDVSTIRNSFDINFLPLGEVERIEILRSGQSSLYGSDAVGGVINIITRSENNKKLNTRINLSTGSYGSRMLDASAAGKLTNGWQYKLQYNSNSAKGFSSALDSNKVKSFDKDGMQQDFLLAQLNSDLKKKLIFRASFQGSKYQNDLDQAAYEDAKDFTANNTNLQYTGSITYKIQKLTLQANYAINNSKREYVDDSASLNGFSKFMRSDYMGRSSFLETYTSYRVSDKLQFIGGLESRWFNTDQSYLSVSQWGNYETALSADSAKVNTKSIFASAVWNNKGFNLESGIRYNDHSRFGNNITYTFNPSYTFNKQWRVALNASSAFKAPTLYQLYDGFSGEKNLKPETSMTSELSLQYIGSKTISLRATVFSRNIKNGIDYDYERYKYFNYNKQVDRGLEMEANWKKESWQLGLNYTYLNGETTAIEYAYDAATYSYIAKGEKKYSNLFRTPKNNLNVQASWKLNERINLSISQRFAGKRTEPQFMSDPVMMKAFQLTDISAQYKLFGKWVIYGSVRNLFDEQYQEVLGFGTRGRNVVLGIRR
jgi:vitamin B12 transporter